MYINIFCIYKEKENSYNNIFKDFEKMLSKYCKVKIVSIFNKNISKAQSCEDINKAKDLYGQVFRPYLKAGFNISLDVLGNTYNTKSFSEVLKAKDKVNFFIAGAYGFSRDFLSSCDESISLSNLTMGHKIAKIVLLEQIFRALCILNKHPYHK